VLAEPRRSAAGAGSRVGAAEVAAGAERIRAVDLRFPREALSNKTYRRTHSPAEQN
jgi:hypothetical protein